MKNIIFFKTTADFDNTGEVLIYKSLLEFIRSHGDVVINDGNGIQSKFLTRIGIRDSERLSVKTKQKFVSYMICVALTNLFRGNRVFFITGVGEHSVSGMKSVVKNMMSFVLLIILRILRVKIIRVGMSIRFDGFWAKFSEKVLSSVINHYYVRDGISFNNCRCIGIKKCKIAPDLSWGYRVPYCEEDKSRNDLYMSFRFYCESKENSETYRKKIEETVKQIVLGIYNKIQGNIVFSYQCDEDELFMNSILRQLPPIPNLIMSKELVTLDNAKKYYGNAALILSNRLHVLLLGYKFGAPTVCVSDIENHRKIQGIFLDNGLEANLLDYNLSADVLNELILKKMANRNSIEENYRSVERANYQKLLDVFSCVFEK